MQANRKIFPKLALLLASSLLSVAVAEFSLRVLLDRDLNSRVEHRIPHPVLGWALEPGKPSTMRYRIVLSSGTPQSDQVDAWFDGYAR